MTRLQILFLRLRYGLTDAQARAVAALAYGGGDD